MKKIFPMFVFFALTILFVINLVGAQEGEMIEAGTVRIDQYGISQVWVPPGCFNQGTSEEEAAYALTLDPPSWAEARIPAEQPQHQVCFEEGFWIDQYEVTYEAFQVFADDDGYVTEEYWSEEGWAWVQRQRRSLPIALEDCEAEADPSHPRTCITWYEAEAYANWRSGRLPTESQWEYAARGPENFIFPWDNEWDPENANVVASQGTMPVGSYPMGVSWVGAHDMAGNAMEWVQDWLSPDYADFETWGPYGIETGTHKVEKGGWWGSNSFVARSAYRHFEDRPTYQDHHIGFRVVTLPTLTDETLELTEESP